MTKQKVTFSIILALFLYNSQVNSHPRQARSDNAIDHTHENLYIAMDIT